MPPSRSGEERFRPIIMTSLAFIFGVLPLAIATGAGANARHSIGTGIMGGMIGEATLAMMYVPLFFYLFDNLTERNKEKKMKKAAAEGHPPDTQHGGSLRKTLHPPRRGVTDMRRMLVVSALATCLTGCMIGPDYKRPVIEAPQSFRYEPKEVADTANSEWWKQFNDPLLEHFIAEALVYNKSVKIAAANVALAAGSS